MASLAELSRLGTCLNTRQLTHLQNLIGWWSLLADISFADLLLLAPADAEGTTFAVLSQVRPTTSQTLYRDDHVGFIVTEIDRPLAARAYRLGETVEGEIRLALAHQRARVLCVPVRCDGQVIAVLSREVAPDFAAVRSLGELEGTYLGVFELFANMVARGQFPYPGDEISTDEVPRIGDGVLLVDNDARITYASPNALSSLHRIGVPGNAAGRRLSELGVDQMMVRSAINSGMPSSGEVERREVTVQVLALPILDGDERRGAMVLLRDVSELRRRDRLLMSKDATIREIHHRVKNNLQTISSLLRLQGRRISAPEAKEAIEVSVRRIRAISMVHETLANEEGDDVSIIDIARQLVATTRDFVRADKPIRFAVEGDVDVVASDIVTPLAVVLNELLQNVVDHAFPDGSVRDDGYVGSVTVSFDLVGSDRLVMKVIDDGVGIPDDFSVDEQGGLGMSIITALTRSDLDGLIEMKRGEHDKGTVTSVTVPLEKEGL